MESRSNVICAKLAYMNSSALFVGVSNTQLVESMMPTKHDSGIEHKETTELLIAKFAEGEKQCHFNYDG
jgi:hypothetical protein